MLELEEHLCNCKYYHLIFNYDKKFSHIPLVSICLERILYLVM